MDRKQDLFDRLDTIAGALEQSGNGLALIGLGSVGLETDRIDDYSDLDFFAIVRPGTKQAFLNDLSWLSAGCPVAYAFQNTVDGFKVLYEDGLYAEFAVFEPQELAHIPFARGRLVWAAQGSGIDATICIPQHQSQTEQPHPAEWQLGEALTNLLVGLGRYRRGEKLSAMRFIQEFAVDRVIALAPLLETEQPGFPDAFDQVRRFELRYPRLAAYLPEFTQGYERTLESARAILHFLEAHFDVHPKVKVEILKLCGDNLEESREGSGE